MTDPTSSPTPDIQLLRELLRQVAERDIRVSADGTASIRTGWQEDPAAPSGSPYVHQTIAVYQPLADVDAGKAKLLAEIMTS